MLNYLSKGFRKSLQGWTVVSRVDLRSSSNHPVPLWFPLNVCSLFLNLGYNILSVFFCFSSCEQMGSALKVPDHIFLIAALSCYSLPSC
jgi:hypothetical protein